MRTGDRRSLRKHAHIAVMDSDRECVGLLLKELKNLGYRAEAVEQTKTLLRMVKHDLIDVLILAVDAWGGGRFELIPLIKRLNRSLPIIVTSGDDSLETAGKVREQGILFYAIKPLDMHEIEIVLKKALARASIYQKPITLVKQTHSGNGLEHDILNINEASKILKLSRNTLSKLARQGDIPACRVANRWYFIKNQVYEWMRIKAAGNQCNYSTMILETMDEGVAVVDRRLRIISCNSAYLKALDVPRDSVIGEPCYRVSHRSVSPCNEPICPVRKAFKTQQVVKVLHVNYDNEGRERYCDVVALPIKDADGKINSVLEIIRDNTDIYSLNRHLNSVMRFFARESKATLGTVMMNISALADENLSTAIERPKRDEMLASSLHNLKLMQDTIRNYIVSYQAENGRLQCNKSTVDVVDDIIEPVISETAPFLRKRAISIDAVAGKSRPVNCDPELLKLAFTNMIAGVAKHAMSTSTIRCSTEIYEDLNIVVSGVGVSIPHEKFRAISEGILDVEHKEMSDAEMGLHIAKKIAEIHDGVLSIETGHIIEDKNVPFDESRLHDRSNLSGRVSPIEFVRFRLRIPHVDVHWEDGGDK